MCIIPYSADHLAESIGQFAEKITPQRERWAYCLDRCSYVHVSEKYGSRLALNERTYPVVDRIVGGRPGGAKFRLGRMMRLGIDAALEQDAFRNSSIIRPWFAVGPMQAWNVGHLYFFRVASHPHVVKIGFSRRVRDRMGDVETKVKTDLVMRKGEIRVGTLADEHWWHKNWSRHNISGEWFFDPHMPERTLPDFLSTQKQEAA